VSSWRACTPSRVASSLRSIAFTRFMISACVVRRLSSAPLLEL
jgi:hypothetical protein